MHDVSPVVIIALTDYFDGTVPTKILLHNYILISSMYYMCKEYKIKQHCKYIQHGIYGTVKNCMLDSI